MYLNSGTIFLRKLKPKWKTNAYILGYDKLLDPKNDCADTGSDLRGMTIKIPEVFNPESNSEQIELVYRPNLMHPS